MRNSTYNFIYRSSLLIALMLGLAACGGGGGAGTTTAAAGSVSSGTSGSSSTGAGSGGTGGSTSGSISLGWTAPVTRADGSPLSLADIDGYRVYYGTSAGNYTQQFDETDGTATSTTVNNLPVGTYYLVMTTYDSGGRESAQSAVITKNAI